jgi:hypothetical protein
MSRTRGRGARKASKKLYSNRKKIPPDDYLDTLDAGHGKQSDMSIEALNKISYDDLFPENEADMDTGLIYEIKRDTIERKLNEANISAAKKRKLDKAYLRLNNSKKPTLNEQEFYHYHSEQKKKG